MTTNCFYMIPEHCESAPTSKHRALVLEFVTACESVVQTGSALTEPAAFDSPYQKALKDAQQAAFSVEWGICLTTSLCEKLSQVCHQVVLTSQTTLLDTARQLELEHAHSSAYANHSARFGLQIFQLITLCCTLGNTTNTNLIQCAQNLIPHLSRLSSQIDNEINRLVANTDSICVAADELAEHMSHVERLTAFNVQVYRSIISAQGIVQMISNWQSQLVHFMKISPSDVSAHYHLNQVKAGIMHWEDLMTTLNARANLKLDATSDLFKVNHKPRTNLSKRSKPSPSTTKRFLTA